MSENIWTKLLQLLKKSAKSSTSLDEKSDATDDDFELPTEIHVTDILDLHGTTISIIPEMIDAFLDNALDLHLDRVQIIHGKGKSKLKHLTYQLLKDDPRVLHFYDAPPELGGWGRTVVELNSPLE
jgi:DNA mismatch repair protein MutS2